MKFIDNLQELTGKTIKIAMPVELGDSVAMLFTDNTAVCFHVLNYAGQCEVSINTGYRGCLRDEIEDAFKELQLR
jgi:hypothetical protein